MSAAERLGDIRLVEMRALAEQTPVGIILLDGMSLRLQNGGGYAWVALRAQEVVALLDELDELRAETAKR